MSDASQDVAPSCEATVKPKRDRDFTLGEEIANAITHGVGALASIVALIVLVSIAAIWGNAWHLASAIVYGVSLLVLYMASTLYHGIQNPKACKVFKVIDHAGIYLLIAGTYTPFTLVAIRDDGGWWLFTIVWTLAIIGMALEAFWVNRPRWASAAVYLGMGWLAVFAIKPMVANLAPGGVWLLVAGGLAYTLGTIFYVMKSVKWMHPIWHGWVLAGSVLHFLAVMLYVFPRGAS